MEPTSQPNAVSKAEFARMKGVDRSAITRWGQADRIVLDDDGRVLVAESEARLAATADPSKAGVVKRHELERGAPVADLLTVPASQPAGKREKGGHYGDRIRESARHEAAKAERAEIELAQLKGQLTDVEGVQKAMADFATLTRQTYERIRVDMKLRLAVETDPDRIDQLLRDAIDNAARTVSDLLKAQIDAAANTRQ